jgi:hypothetical protein
MLKWLTKMFAAAKPKTLPELLAAQTRRDDQLLDVLTGMKARINEPHEVDHAFVCKTKEAADAIATELRARGMSVPEPNLTGRDYWVHAKQSTVPAEIKMQTRQLVQLAFQNDAEYDGWGTQPRI